MSEDIALLTEAFQGDEHAVRFILHLRDIANVWDDLVDRDCPVPNESINHAFMCALVSVPTNPFYLKHQASLQPVIQQAILSWVQSNTMCATPGISREIAHVQRYAVADIITFVLWLIGGLRLVEQYGPALRVRSQKDCFEDYDHEMDRQLAAPAAETEF